MDHLYSSTVKVMRDSTTVDNGRARVELAPAQGSTERETKLLAALKCRLDLIFLRPGKDAPAAINAGRAPDRTGVMFYSAPVKLNAGDKLVCVPNARTGDMPIEGTFEIKAVPDGAVGYGSVHHYEVQVIETTSASQLENWPD